MRITITAIISLAILGVIYWQIDLGSLRKALLMVDWRYFGLAVIMIFPLTAMSAWRLSFLAPVQAKLSFFQSLNLTLMASVLNVILPSKLGDLTRFYVLTRKGHLPPANALTLVVFEKAWDVLALLFWCSLGLFIIASTSTFYWIVSVAVLIVAFLGVLMVSSFGFAEVCFSTAISLAPGRLPDKIATLQAAWLDTLVQFWSDKRNAAIVIIGSVILWLLHICQIWLFVFALNHTIPFASNAAMASLSIFVGLLPFTFAGIGTRDVALIFFYQPFLAAPVAAALGLFCTLRYLLPALIGLPFLGQYLATARRIKDENDNKGGVS
ncbi:MAG: lysylphosphatidylglycerol synthetase [Rhodospirillaceae bacterium]|nr:lysylphosphatidylglycerol synthetase [Rhodospirillaceae bacterium]